MTYATLSRVNQCQNGPTVCTYDNVFRPFVDLLMKTFNPRQRELVENRIHSQSVWTRLIVKIIVSYLTNFWRLTAGQYFKHHFIWNLSVALLLILQPIDCRSL